MYYCSMDTDSLGINVEALRWAMEKKRKWSPATLSKESKVNKSTISLLLNGKGPSVSAVVVAKLARALEVSTDFLMGFTQNPEQKAEMDLAIAEILAIAKTLSEFRQRDLLLVAKAYQDADDPTAEMMEALFDMVEEVGGEDMRKKLVAALEARRTARNSPRRRRPPTQDGDQEAKSK